LLLLVLVAVAFALEVPKSVILAERKSVMSTLSGCLFAGE
jgi:hypothetical protein